MKFPSGSAWSAVAGTKWALAACALFIAASLGGCAIIEAEKNNRGGFLDHIADERWMQADSKKMRALRAVALEASLARIAMVAPKSAPDRALLARRIGETTKRADVVRQCAFNELQIPGRLDSEPCFFFDSVMVDYENALFDLAMIALPLEETKKLVTRVSGGIASIAINPLELVQTLINIGREAFRYGRVVGAIYRDTLELEVQVWLASPGFETDDRIVGLSRIYARGNDDVLAWRAAIAALRADGLEPIPQPRFILQLYGIIAYICGQIVNKDDPSFRECALPDLRAKLPVVNIPGSRGLVISGIGGGGGGGGGSSSAASQRLKAELEQQKEQQRAIRQELAKIKDQLTVTSRDEWAPYRATLCVTDETTFGPKTQLAVKLFKAALNEKLVTSVSDRLTDNEKTKLIESSKNFPACGRSTNTPPRNAFEVGLYAFNRPESVAGQVSKALTKAKTESPDKFPGTNGTVTVDSAITALRNFYKLPPIDDMPSQELDDRVWARMRN